MICLHCAGCVERRGQAEGAGGGERRAGLGWQTKEATRRCRDGASVFTVAGGHERGGDRKVRGDGEPPSILQTRERACTHVQTHTKLKWARHKSLSLNVCWCWAIHAAFRCSTLQLLILCPADTVEKFPLTPQLFTSTPPKEVKWTQTHSWDTFTGSAVFSYFILYSPLGCSFSLKSHSKAANKWQHNSLWQFRN